MSLRVLAQVHGAIIYVAIVQKTENEGHSVLKTVLILV